MQIFGAAPQQWRRKTHLPEHIAAFRERAAAAGLGPNYIHAIYLINLAAEDPEHRRKSVESLAADLTLAADLDIAGVILHVGSHRGAGFAAALPRVAGAMREALAASPPAVRLCIENSAGAGGSIGATWAEIGALMDAVHDARVQVCVDTCHAFSAGYNLADPKALAIAMTAFGREIGVEHLVAVHANDSKTPLGSGKDRHANIGEGSIGIAGFEAIMAHPAFRKAVFLLEVPGMHGGGPDRENLEVLKAIRARVRPRRRAPAPQARTQQGARRFRPEAP